MCSIASMREQVIMQAQETKGPTPRHCMWLAWACKLETAFVDLAGVVLA